MSRHRNPNLPVGLSERERYHRLKALGLCVKCGMNEATAGPHCENCRTKYLDSKRRYRENCKENYKMERKSIQQKQDYFDFCVEQATKLKISYGEYMALKSRGRV